MAAVDYRSQTTLITGASSGIGADLARRLAAEVERRGLRVTSLVNSAGFGLQGMFHEADAQRLRDMVQLDVAALTEVTRAHQPPGACRVVRRSRSRG